MTTIEPSEVSAPLWHNYGNACMRVDDLRRELEAWEKAKQQARAAIDAAAKQIADSKAETSEA